MYVLSIFFVEKVFFLLRFFFAVSTPTENLKINKGFKAWMDDHANLRTICEEGKGICPNYNLKIFRNKGCLLDELA